MNNHISASVRSSTAVALLLVAAGACGSQQSLQATEPRTLAVEGSVTVAGPLAGTVEAGLQQPEPLVPGEPGAHDIVLTNSGTTEISIEEFVFYEYMASSEEGALGLTGLCGIGWDADGRTPDPCAAADPAVIVEPGEAFPARVVLYPSVAGETTTPGTYRFNVSLDGQRSVDEQLSGALEFTYVVTGEPAPTEMTSRRLGGADRIETAVEVSKAAFPTADAVVVARAEAYADALAAAPLAGQWGGPVLLTGRDGLHSLVADEVRRLGVGRAYVIGSEAALSEAVVDGLRQAGADTVQRLGGATRFETAAAIASQLDERSRGFIVEGVNADPARGWPDAVALSAHASYMRAPVFLVEQDRAPEPTLRAIAELGIGGLSVIGGSHAVSDAVIEQLEQTGVDASRFLPTNNRFETSSAIGGAGLAIGMSDTTPWLVTAWNWPDALVAGPAAAAEASILMLADGEDLESSPATYDWLQQTAAAGTLEQVTIVGDETVISNHVADQVDQLHQEATKR